MTGPDQEPAATGESQPAAPKKPAARYRTIAIGIAGALVLVAALVGTAPFWAPALPWGAARAPITARNEAAPSARINPPAAPQPQPTQPPANQPQAKEPSQPPEPAGQAALAALERLDRRVGALEARPPAASAGDIADLRQQMTKLSSAAADLASRVAALDKQIRSQAGRASVDTALVLALSQIRDAVAAGRPFAAAYEAFAQLSRTRPEIAAAAAPLAGPAKTGVAGRDALAARLRDLAGAIAAATAPANAATKSSRAASGWADEALLRLRGLVTIRRVGDAGRSPPGGGPEAAVKAAERALAGGDFDGAVAALGRLSGAPAEAAGPWLRLMKERLAVEAALDRLDSLLVAQLGAPANAAAAGPPR